VVEAVVGVPVGVAAGATVKAAVSVASAIGCSVAAGVATGITNSCPMLRIEFTLMLLALAIPSLLTSYLAAMAPSKSPALTTWITG
jgi:hypothetical protein